MPVNFDELSAVVRVLKDAAFFDLSPDCTSRRYGTAQWVIRRGYASAGIALLWRYAKDRADNPEALFAFWLANPTRLEKKYAEMMAKPAWIENATKRLNERETSGDMAPIINIGGFRRQG